MKVVEDFESRPHKAVSFVVERGKDMQEWSEQKLTWIQWRKVARKEHQKKSREEGEVDEGGEERRIWGQIVKEVVAGIQEKVSMHDGEKDDVKKII